MVNHNQGDYSHPVEPVKELPLEVRSNCYAYAEYILGDLPSMATLQSTAQPAFGRVAIFNYDGVPHVAVTLSDGIGSFTVKESNFEGDWVSTRTVYYNDPSLLGFK